MSQPNGLTTFNRDPVNITKRRRLSLRLEPVKLSFIFTKARYTDMGRRHIIMLQFYFSVKNRCNMGNKTRTILIVRHVNLPLPISHLCKNHLLLSNSHLYEIYMCTSINCKRDISWDVWLRITNQNGQ